MKTSSIFSTFLVLLTALPLSNSAFAQGKFAVTLDRTAGPVVLDTILAVGDDVPVRFILRLKNDSTQNFAVSNGFRVYSPNGAVWDSTRGDTLGWRSGDPTPGEAILSKSTFDLPYAVLYNGVDDAGADTVGFLGAKLFGTGMAAGFNDTAWSVNIYGVSVASDGKLICLDTAWFPPGGAWKWQASGTPTATFPTWDGVHCFVVKAFTSNADDEKTTLPNAFALSQNYPNPFNPTTTINFDIPVNSRVDLSIFNVLGQRVRTLVDREMSAGQHQVVWDGTNDSGSRTASGIYFYRIQAGNYVESKKMVMLK